MSKSKTKSNLVTSIISIALAVFSFVCMAFKFISITAKGGDKSNTQNINFSDWLEFFDYSSILPDSINWWQTARVFLIITLVVVAIVAVLALVQLFVSNKFLALVLKIASIVGIVVALVYLIAMIGGCIALSIDFSSDFGTVSYGPHIGATLLGVSALASSICGLTCAKSK